jgi:hypothetical protein
MNEIPINEEYIHELERKNVELWKQNDELHMELAMSKVNDIIYDIRKNRRMPPTHEMLEDIKFLLGFIDRFHVIYGSRTMGKTKFLNIRAKYMRLFK